MYVFRYCRDKGSMEVALHYCSLCVAKQPIMCHIICANASTNIRSYGVIISFPVSPNKYPWQIGMVNGIIS